MAKEVVAQGVPAELGNILAPNWKSWQNNGSQYYTGGAAIGQPTPITYWVPQHNAAGNPTWVQPPYRKYTSERPVYNATAWTTTFVPSLFPSSAALYPVANSPLQPPIGSIT